VTTPIYLVLGSTGGIGRIGEPEDVASAIEWLLEPGNTWVSGQVISVDGGLATLRGRARA
jgi:NAD(P)-dependent dehydrogenase (short-subunit alcohol dehydrogenase family)